MIKIDKQNYINFYDLFSELGSYTFMISALEGKVASQLYADDSRNPTYAILLTADCYYIVGDLSAKYVKHEIFKLSQSATFNDFTGIIFSNNNIERIKEIFAKHTYKYIERKAYHLEKSEINYSIPTISNAKIVELTPNNISKFKNYKNFNDVYEECKFYWDEYPKVSKINFSTALINNNTILSCCYLCGESSSENSCELGIDTFKGFRRKGYAVTLCQVTIIKLIELGYEKFIWHCHADNIASNKTALKLGFKLDAENHLAWFKKNIDCK